MIGNMEYEMEKGIIKGKNKVIKLTEKENALLNILANNLGVILSREELQEKINEDNDERSIDVQITRIRKKIEEDSKTPQFLQTIRGKGYVKGINDK